MTEQESQRGSAAIELAFSLILLLMLFFAFISYGALFWAQQKISHLAGEGARMAVTARFQGQDDPDKVKELVYAKVTAMKRDDFLLESLAGFGCALYRPALADGTLNSAACGELACATPDLTHSYATLIVCGQVRGWPLLDMMRGLAGLFGPDASKLLPETLSAQAVVQL